MSFRIRHGLIISISIIGLFIASVVTSYAEKINYIYDELNRLIRVEYGDGTKVVYTYDGVGNRSQVYVGKYTLTVNVVGSGTVNKNPDQPIYSAGTSVTLTAVNGSQTFSEWSGDLTGNTNPSTIVMDGNKSVTATFVTPEGWLQGWTYRKAVTLSRTSGAVTNYQMKLLVGESSGAVGYNVHCNGHVQADFDDLRFTTSDGTTLLNYWIESITGTTPNQLATIWIKFDSIGTTATTFYMYYGKADAPAYSNGTNTFIKFDDFERGINGDPIGGAWQNVNTQTISTDHAYGGTRSGKFPANSNNIWISGTNCTENRAVRVRMWKEDLTGWMMGMWGISTWNCRYFGDANEDIYTVDSINRDTGYNMTADAWGLWEIYDVNLTAHTYSLRYNGTIIGTNLAMMNAGFGAFGFFNTDPVSGHDFYLDDYIVKNYANPEPAWGSWGAEITPEPPTGTITINSGAASTNSVNVTLTLSCSDPYGCSQMQFSNDNVTYSTPEAYATSKAWTLTSGDGTKTVYVKFKDTPGNWSTAYSNTIFLDTAAPMTTASPAGGIYNTAQTVTLTCSDGLGSGCDKIYYTTDSTTPTTSSLVYTSPINISLTTTLKFFAKDLAGNSEAVKSETYTISTNVVIVELKDSTGAPISGGIVQYYSGGWQTFGTTDASGRVSKELTPGSYTFSMNYAFARQEKAQNTATNPTVVFQTVGVGIQLKDSTGALMDTGTVQYYSGGWHDIGNTSVGQVSKELLPGSYTFSMNYSYARQEKAQNIATNPVVVFQTIGVTIQLKDNTGALMDTGTVQYYSGGWRDIGSTSGGQVTKELLPASYTFSMNYGYARQEKAQNIATDPTVVFQTIGVIVQLKDSTGTLMDTGTVQYYSGGWHDIGSTSGGQVSKELLAGSYTFSMNYGFARQEKAQNISADPTIVFQTVGVKIQLKDSTGALIDTGTVQYYSGGWRDIGSTSGGQVTKELLPGSYTFSMNYAFARQEKAQNIAADPTVVFQTIEVTVQLKDSTGALMDTGTVQYYSGGWRDIGSTSGGQVTKELLPASYTFSMNYGFARQEKAQNVATNPTVVFQTIGVTVQLKDSTGALIDTGTVQYYSGGWRDIGSTSGGQASKELLSGSYTFSMNYAFARQEKAQNIAADPTVVFQTIGVAVQLKDSTGTLMDTGTVQYYSGGWRDIGSTSGGQVSKELLPGSYTFSINYSFARQEKAQDVATNPTVVFQTIGVIVQLKDSTGALMDTGTVQYYSGGWRDIGSTSGGQVTKELLPGSYTFSINYSFARQEKAQNITANPTVVFQTGQVHSDSGSCTNYYAGGWRAFTQDMELLPLAYTFRFNDTTPDTSYTIITGTVNHIH